jgi:histidinol-phosphate aminotransferase
MIELGDNTSRWGAPPSALQAMRAASESALSGYPQIYSQDLKTVLADYAGVDEDMIVTGCGSDDILDSTIRAVAAPGDRMTMLDPTFVMVPIFARLHGLVLDRIPLDAAYGISAAEFVARDARITYLCSPNNPTGTPIARATIEAIVSRSKGIVLLDEAYFEFSRESMVPAVREFPNLVIARTLSKAFGLAGLRVGYGIAAPSMIEKIEKARGPFTVSAMSEQAAAAAVANDNDWVRDHVARSVDGRERLLRELRQRDIDVPPSATNFVFAPIANARTIAERMHERGVSVRSFSGLPEFTPSLVASRGEALRIAAAPADEIDVALRVFDEVRRECE